MLGKSTKEIQVTKIDSIVGAEAVFEGNLTTTETTRVDGVVRGDIQSGGTLIVGPGGKVAGNIKAANIMVAGTVEGDLVADGKIEAASTGVIVGNIETKCLFIDENAIFQGQCNMHRGTIGSLTVNKEPETVQA